MSNNCQLLYRLYRNNDKKCYTAGDELAGGVLLKVTKAMDVRRIYVELVGISTTHCKTKSKTNSYYTARETKQFLSLTQEVFPTPELSYDTTAYTFVGGSEHKYKFSMFIPEQCNGHDCSSGPLPPSLARVDEGPITGEVSYTFRVIVKGPVGMVASESQELTFIPPNYEDLLAYFVPMATKDIQTYNHQTKDVPLQLSFINNVNALEVKEKLQFQLEVFCPIANLYPHFRLSDGRSSRSGVFAITGMKASLIETTTFRAQEANHTFQTTKIILDVAFGYDATRFDIANFDRSGSGFGKILEGSNILKKHSLVIPQNAVPDYDWFNGQIKRTNAIEVEIEITRGLQKVCRKFQFSQPLRITGRKLGISRSSIDTSVNLPIVRQFQLETEVEELPPYEEVPPYTLD